MKKVTLFGGALIVPLLSAPAMAADFYALSSLTSTPTSISNLELSEVEGGAYCTNIFADSGGGVALCAEVWSHFFTRDRVDSDGRISTSHSEAHFYVANENPITGANFLQAVN
jgi:hypothetical protein